MIDEIYWLASSFLCVTWKHIYRDSNFVVDIVTNMGLSVSNMHIWDRTLPLRATPAFVFDFNSIGCSRGFSL